jgi:hypothetical protein
LRSLAFIATRQAIPAVTPDLVVRRDHGVFSSDMAGTQQVLLADLVEGFDDMCAHMAHPAVGGEPMAVAPAMGLASVVRVPLGKATNVVQYLRPHRVDGGACVWRDF